MHLTPNHATRYYDKHHNTPLSTLSSFVCFACFVELLWPSLAVLYYMPKTRCATKTVPTAPLLVYSPWPAGQTITLLGVFRLIGFINTLRNWVVTEWVTYYSTKHGMMSMLVGFNRFSAHGCTYSNHAPFLFFFIFLAYSTYLLVTTDRERNWGKNSSYFERPSSSFEFCFCLCIQTE